MSVEEKIDILFYLLGIFFAFFTLSLFVNLRRSLFPKLLDKWLKRISDWDDQEQYDSILENIDGYIEQFPGETNLRWAKARALYKKGNYENARSIYSQIAESEPLWKEDADKYIQSIDEKASQ